MRVRACVRVRQPERAPSGLGAMGRRIGVPARGVGSDPELSWLPNQRS